MLLVLNIALRNHGKRREMIHNKLSLTLIQLFLKWLLGHPVWHWLNIDTTLRHVIRLQRYSQQKLIYGDHATKFAYEISSGIR